MHEQSNDVTGGVDTHSDVHVAGVVDTAGRVLGTASFDTTLAGYRRLLTWLRGHGQLVCVGVEGTGSYGAGLARFLTGEAVTVIEVNRPNRQTRRRHGKSDVTDAIAAARAALNGDADGTPKAGDGVSEAIRAVHVARRSAIKAKTQAANQIRDLIVTAPDQLRCQLHDLDTAHRVERCARFRPGELTDPTEAVKTSLRHLARRHQALDTEIAEHDTALASLTARANPALRGAHGVGPDTAATLLITAGDNPDRLRSEASFAALCGVSPIPASSGKTNRFRLNRGGDRQANKALWRIAMIRLQHDERTRVYAEHRRSQGKSNREILRCLKRHIAREMFTLLTNPPTVPDGDELRAVRLAAGISLADAAEQLGTWATRLSQLERGITHNTDLATRYHHWLHRTT